MGRPMVNQGRLYWTGQHWINYIRPVNADENSGMVSLWHTHYSSAGEGNVAYVLIEDGSSYQRICTDSPETAAFIQRWMGGRGGMYDMNLEITRATFTRDGGILDSPSWTIETADDLITARWSDLQSPALLEAPRSETQRRMGCYFRACSSRIPPRFFSTVILLKGNPIPSISGSPVSEGSGVPAYSRCPRPLFKRTTGDG